MTEKVPWALPVSQISLYETLQVRISRPFRIPLNEIFIVCPAPRNRSTGGWEEFECDYTLLPDDRFPSLSRRLPVDIKVFFVKECPSSKILWKKKFNYPRISSPKNPKS